MFRRWHHGHSTGLGVLLGLALTRHGLLLGCGGMALGVVLGRTWATSVMVAGMIAAKLGRSKRERISTRPVPVYGMKARGAQTDEIPF